MGNFVWNNFGKLVKVTLSPSLVLIENECGKVLKMSLNRYKESAQQVYQNALKLKGQMVTVRTSQNTGNWDSAEWFSDLKLDSVMQGPNSDSNIAENQVDKIAQKDRCLSCEGKGFYLYAGGSKTNSCSNCAGTGIRAEARKKKEIPFNSKDSTQINHRPTISSRDYSNSYVQGDLGGINTKFWNGY